MTATVTRARGLPVGARVRCAGERAGVRFAGVALGSGCVRFGSVRCGAVRCGAVRCCSLLFGSAQFGPVRRYYVRPLAGSIKIRGRSLQCISPRGGVRATSDRVPVGLSPRQSFAQPNGPFLPPPRQPPGPRKPRLPRPPPWTRPSPAGARALLLPVDGHGARRVSLLLRSSKPTTAHHRHVHHLHLHLRLHLHLHLRLQTLVTSPPPRHQRLRAGGARQRQACRAKRCPPGSRLPSSRIATSDIARRASQTT